MRIVNWQGRAALALDGRAVDIERASGGRIGADPLNAYAAVDALQELASDATASEVDPELVGSQLSAPVPRPRQVIAVGLNYAEHAREGGREPEKVDPMIFTKFPSSITGPFGELELPDGFVDYEAELVAVVGRGGRNISAADALDRLAGLTCGQDLSERIRQLSPPMPQQFSLAKSLAGFSPIGPSVVSLDELADPNDLAIECVLSGETVQSARTSEMIFNLAEIVEYVSRYLELLPGDLIFTGTPAGIGYARQPQRRIQIGDELVTRIEGLGEMTHRFVAQQTGA